MPEQCLPTLVRPGQKDVIKNRDLKDEPEILKGACDAELSDSMRRKPGGFPFTKKTPAGIWPEKSC